MGIILGEIRKSKRVHKRNSVFDQGSKGCMEVLWGMGEEASRPDEIAKKTSMKDTVQSHWCLVCQMRHKSWK